jgi:hypothetical protein
VGERLDGVLGGAGDGGDLDPAADLDHPAEHRPGDHRIVDDHQPDVTPAAEAPRPFGRAPGHRSGPQATPTS